MLKYSRISRTNNRDAGLYFYYVKQNCIALSSQIKFSFWLPFIAFGIQFDLCFIHSDCCLLLVSSTRHLYLNFIIIQYYILNIAWFSSDLSHSRCADSQGLFVLKYTYLLGSSTYLQNFHLILLYLMSSLMYKSLVLLPFCLLSVAFNIQLNRQKCSDSYLIYL